MSHHYPVLLLSFFAGSAFAACAPAPAGIADIQANGYSTESHHSVINPALKAKNEAAVKPFNDFLRAVSDNADRYIANADKAPAQCALSWLDGWAQDRAMLCNARKSRRGCRNSPMQFATRNSAAT